MTVFIAGRAIIFTSVTKIAKNCFKTAKGMVLNKSSFITTLKYFALKRFVKHSKVTIIPISIIEWEEKV